MSLKLALAVRETVAGHRLGVLEGGGGCSRPGTSEIRGYPGDGSPSTGWNADGTPKASVRCRGLNRREAPLAGEAPPRCSTPSMHRQRATPLMQLSAHTRGRGVSDGLFPEKLGLRMLPAVELSARAGARPDP